MGGYDLQSVNEVSDTPQAVNDAEAIFIGGAMQAREQPAVLEEDVHELPEDVVGGLDLLLARADHPVGTRSSYSAPTAANAIVSAPAARDARTAALDLRARAERHRDVVGADEQRPHSAHGHAERGQCALPTMTGWTNSTATWRTSLTSRRRRAERDEPPAAREALGHHVAERG